MSASKPETDSTDAHACWHDNVAMLTALREAAAQALDLARETGTPCWVRRDGKMVNIGAPLPSTQTTTKSTA
uniref:Uncharacterized protein n=1 Tax=mine drainage metagenome TaxID=410659 RepID=E6PU50_9ZZZZ